MSAGTALWVAILVLCQVTAAFCGGQEQLVKVRVERNGKPCAQASIIPEEFAFDERLKMPNHILLQTDENGHLFLPIFNSSEAPKGAAEHEDLT